MSTSELAWFKSSYSSSASGDCVEVALTPAIIHVRDSKAPQERQLALSTEAWGAFVSHCRKG
ncbi:DUF397 domain-containing protein [Streptomyces sp. ISL-22]|uniref:DUF397 domain-containing protein n=1 Tax=unclassified Streptomyces TaxID=2593676 RepID=UPI001BECE283|nr:MULTISPECIES: DUF397 domain-containing protein [unclassified Streptomyces]MBT2420119.1 DUF397 domain-containing protein [Streptomyces sp. ISL-24]MBT2433993.1 DUF397 domain-containing protein [Streptomyces sp. ISL-22]